MQKYWLRIGTVPVGSSNNVKVYGNTSGKARQQTHYELVY